MILLHALYMGLCIHEYCSWKLTHLSWDDNLTFYEATWYSSTEMVQVVHQWLENDAQNLKWHRIGDLLFGEVIWPISSLHRGKTWRFGSDLRISRSQLQSNFNSHMAMKYTNSFLEHGRGSLLIVEVVCQISRSHRQKNRFRFDLIKITRPVEAIKSLRFALLP